jgi:pimeloyl-ACP methyl ester carboxylesterase
MEQQIRFCTAPDGVSIAYAVIGDGPPLVYATGWPQHLELEWERPFVRRYLETMADGFTLIRYDMRGTGLSDRDVSDFSLESLGRDLEAVVDHLKLDRFTLLSLGLLAGPITIGYAVSHPDRVSHLVLCSTLLRGGGMLTPARQKVLIEYVENFGFPLGGDFGGDALDAEEQRHVREVQRVSVSEKAQADILRTMFSVDVGHLVEKISVPTLVMHARSDILVPFSQGRELAARLPDARFVPFKSDTTATWSQADSVIPELRKFVGVDVEQARTPGAAFAGAVQTILFTDIEGSTALTDRLGDAKARELFRQHERVVREALADHGGSEVRRCYLRLRHAARLR